VIEKGKDLVFLQHSLLLLHADVPSSQWRAQRTWFVPSPYKSCSLKKKNEIEKQVYKMLAT